MAANTLTVRTQQIAIKEETTENTYTPDSAGGDFIKAREGTSITPSKDSVQSDEFTGGIAASAPFSTKETPTATLPKYVKHSGTEGQAPDYGLLVESLLGTENVIATEHTTDGGSSAGTASARGVVSLGSGGSSHAVGECILVKDITNGYTIVPIHSISSNDLTLGFNLSAAPGSGVGIGKAVHYAPANTGQATFTLHRYQASTSSGMHEAVTGCRTVGANYSFTANELASVEFSVAGLSYYLNPITITAGSNDDIDFTDDAGTVQATLTAKTYKTPHDLADEVASKMTAASVGSGNDTITCTYDDTTGKFTITSNGSTFSLLWNTGAGDTAAAALGFSAAGNDTGATTYTSDNAQTYEPNATPAPDDQDALVVKNAQVQIGQFDRIDCREAREVTVSIQNTKSDIDDICAETGASGSLLTQRQTTISATLIYEKYETKDTDRLLNNEDTQFLIAVGEKDSAGNWIPGTCMAIWCPQAKVTVSTIAETDSYMVLQVEATAYATSTQDDVHITYL